MVSKTIKIGTFYPNVDRVVRQEDMYCFFFQGMEIGHAYALELTPDEVNQFLSIFDEKASY